MLVKLATSKQELDAAYHIRYQCLTVELGDNSYAHHQDKIFTDDDDLECHRIFVAYVDDVIVGTARLLMRKEHPFIEDDFYIYPQLASLFSLPTQELMEKIALIDRVCILKAYRGHNIFTVFYNTILAEMRHNHCCYLLAAIHHDNVKSQAVFVHFGFKQLPELRHCGSWQGYLYCRFL
jgi:GNAT superfamily N-acetyltransferase